METQDSDIFGETSNESDSFSDVQYLKKPSNARYRPSPKRLLPPLKPIDFAKYVQDNYQDKIKILQRSTFGQFGKPVVIFFNHFHEKCAYHIKCLEKLHKLSVKYGDRIEFLAADMLDIDVINVRKSAIDSFCHIGSPEKVTSIIYAIDKDRRIHEHSSGDKSLETLMYLCENLLEGSLFRSQPLPVVNNSSLVKICVHNNYQELVVNSKHYILLVVNLEDYNELNLEYEPNFETVAQQLLTHQVDVVYINGEQNYVPHELGISSYPTLLLLNADDKTTYVEPLIGPYTTDNIIECIKDYLKDPHSYVQKLPKNHCQPLNIAPDLNLDFLDLQQYLQDNCLHYLKVFKREAFLRSNRYIIIVFMDFCNGKCLAHHLKCIEQIAQVARNLNSPREYFIADFKDIDVINPAWKPQDFIRNSNSLESNVTKIFGIDLNRNKFVLKDFRSPASLYYFAYSLTNGELYISEPWPHINESKLVKTCIADSLNLSIASAKQDILLTIYYSNGSENTQQFLQFLEELAQQLEKLGVKVMRIDSRLNCIPLELDNTMYPILYYIPQANKGKRILYDSGNRGKGAIVDFIVKNMKENEVPK